MDSERVRQLLEKYWNCETTLEEEQALKAYFNGPAVEEAFADAAPLFRYLQDEKKTELGESFEKDVTKKLPVRHESKIISMVTFRNIARIAAGILVVVVATVFIRNEIRKSIPAEQQDTYTDPELAFEETKRALQMISNSFSRAKRETEKVKMLNDAEKKIQGKAEPQANI